jgi:hypothetical protein
VSILRALGATYGNGGGGGCGCFLLMVVAVVPAPLVAMSKYFFGSVIPRVAKMD